MVSYTIARMERIRGGIAQHVVSDSIETQGDAIELTLKLPDPSMDFREIGRWRNMGNRIVWIYRKSEHVPGQWVCKATLSEDGWQFDFTNPLMLLEIADDEGERGGSI